MLRIGLIFILLTFSSSLKIDHTNRGGDIHPIFNPKNYEARPPVKINANAELNLNLISLIRVSESLQM